MILYLKKAIGCLIAAAYGDALGSEIEFMNTTEIVRIYGPGGINIPPTNRQGLALITDDTQMAIATARGIAVTPNANTDQVVQNVYQQYLLWLDTQNDPSQVRAPGNTCLGSLKSGRMGTIQKPISQSMGCGGIMRAHPAGIAYYRDPQKAWDIGIQTSAITHGHPNGYVPGGAIALLVSAFMNDLSIDAALQQLDEFLDKLPDEISKGTRQALKQAFDAPKKGDYAKIIDQQVGQTIPNRGGGWLGHDALAIAIYGILCAPTDPLKAISIATNHSGDSDSTGSIAGAIMGAIYGPDLICDHLRKHKIALERKEELIELATQLITIR